jgi:DNA invertase Pin-like site-specific DNA recombinase
MEQLQFVGCHPEQLQKAIAENIRGQLEELKKSFQPKTPEEFLSRKATAKLLNINLSTLYLWTKKGVLQSYGISGKVYYKRSEVESALIEL